MKVKNSYRDYPLVFITSILLFIMGVWRVQVNIIPMRIYLNLGFSAIITLSLAYLIWRYIGNIWVALFLLLVYIAHLNLRSGVFTTEAGTKTFFYVFVGMFWYFFIAFFYPWDKISYLYNIFCIIALCNILLLVLQTFRIDPFRNTIKLWPVGFLTNPNEVSVLLALLFPAFFRRKWAYFMPFVIIGLILSRCYVGLFGFIISYGFFILFTEGFKFTFIYLLCLYGLGYLVIRFIGVPNYKVRWEIWSIIFDKFRPYWKWGYGLGEFKNMTKWNLDFFYIEGRVWFETCHNDIIQAIFEMGCGFIIILGGYLLNIIHKCFKHGIPKIPLTALISIIVVSLCSYPFHNGCNAIFTITWLAILDKQWTKRTFIKCQS